MAVAIGGFDAQAGGISLTLPVRWPGRIAVVFEFGVSLRCCISGLITVEITRALQPRTNAELIRNRDKCFAGTARGVVKIFEEYWLGRVPAHARRFAKMAYRSSSLSVVKTWTLFRAREMVTYHCCALVAAPTAASAKRR
jgi:hypothetical protein